MGCDRTEREGMIGASKKGRNEGKRLHLSSATQRSRVQCDAVEGRTLQTPGM